MAHRPRIAGPRAGRGFWAGLIAFGLLSVVTVLWSLSVPLASSPDEPHHIVKAVAVWRGEWLGTHATGFNSSTMTVLVPQTFARAVGNFDCYRQRAAIPASCAKPIVAGSKIVPARTHVGRYPPLYYLLVGWPSLLSVAESTMRWMRVISGLINAGVLALAVSLIRRFRLGAGVLVGVCCAMTPVAIYMDSTVQPNGLEVSLGILVTVCLIGLARYARTRAPGEEGDPTRPPRAIVHSAGAGAAALVLVRGLSPLWLGCLGVLALILVPWSSWRAWLRLGVVRVWIGIVAVCSGLALAWIVGAHALDIQPWPASLNVYTHVSDWREVQLVLGREGWYAKQMVGALTKESQLPVGAYVVAFTAFSLLVIAGLVRGTGRERAALCVSVVAVAAIPVVLAAPRIRQNGVNWQGRYGLPFAVAIVLVAASAAFRPGLSLAGRRVAASLVAGTFLLGGVSYWSTLRRYTVSTLGPHDLLGVTHPAWSPVLPVLLLAALVPAVLVALAVVFTSLLARCEPELPTSRRSRAADPEPLSDAALVPTTR